MSGDLLGMIIGVGSVLVMIGIIYVVAEYDPDWHRRLMGRPTYMQRYYMNCERQARAKADQLFTEAETKMNRLAGQDDRFKFDDWGSL